MGHHTCPQAARLLLPGSAHGAGQRGCPPRERLLPAPPHPPHLHSRSQASLGKQARQLAIPFYWLMWASGQAELGLNQYSFYYVIVGK